MDTPATPAPQAIDWVFASRAGDRDALEQLWRSCRDYLLLAAAKGLSPELQAKVSPSDIVQETLRAAHGNLRQFRGHTEAELHAWLRRILENKVRAAHRQFLVAEKRNVRREIPLQADPDSTAVGGPELVFHGTPWRSLVANERAIALRAAIQKLPDTYRYVIVARAWQRRSFAELAVKLGRSEAAVRKIWLRGLERLAQECQSHDCESRS